MAMNRQQRRAQQRDKPVFKREGEFITMPIGEFAGMFGLSDEEVGAEWQAGRLDGLVGKPVADGWDQVAIQYDAIVAWLSRKDLPPPLREKTKDWFAQLHEWLHQYKQRCEFKEDPATGGVVLVLPDGREIRGLYFRKVRRH